jgi:hypothetical protein
LLIPLPKLPQEDLEDDLSPFLEKSVSGSILGEAGGEQANGVSAPDRGEHGDDLGVVIAGICAQVGSSRRAASSETSSVEFNRSMSAV